MNFKNVYLISLVLAVPVAILASQQRGKFGGTHSRQLPKKFLRVGPEQLRQHKQEAWEIIVARKAQKGAQAVKATRFAVMTCSQSLPAADLPTIYECQAIHSPHHRLGNIRFPAVMTAMGFIVLLMASPALAAVEVKPGPRGVCTSWRDWDNALTDQRSRAPIVDECVKLQDFIIQYKPKFDEERALAKQYESICPTDYPAYPSVKCPDMQAFVHDVLDKGCAIRNECNCCNPQSLPGKFKEVEVIADTLIAFINRINKKSEEFHACLASHEKAETERRIATIEGQNAEIMRQNAEIMRQNAELAKQYAEIIRMKTEEQNKEAIRHALALIKTVNIYMDEHMIGRRYQFNPRYQQAFDFFSKNPEHCVSDPDEECKRELSIINDIEVLSQSVSDEELIRELTSTALKEQATGL